MSICIYPGSFDPFTNGHLDLLIRASKIFDQVIVGVLINSDKKGFFTTQERKEFITLSAKEAGIENFAVETFNGLTIDFAKEQSAHIIIRGLRAVTDFEYELQIAATNKKLAPDIETMFLMTNTLYSYLSSSIVKEIATYGGCIAGLVPDVTRNTIAERLLKK